MAEAQGPASGLPAAVQNTASVIASALDGGGSRLSVPDLAGSVALSADDPLLVACVRVLGADALAPALLYDLRPAPADVALAEAARDGYPPQSDAPAATAWSHWGLAEALRTLTGHGVRETQPDADWVAGEPWPRLAHRMAQLAPLASPGLDSALATGAAKRPVDLGRGFVRAVRRRDWLQAAGVGRWLALVPGVPASLGLDAGLEFVRHLGAAEDARVALHVRAAQLIRVTAPVRGATV
ncbi:MULTISPECIES: hypothetical protein [unclassified Streptomyces]|uniref:hypothetical protein n=1 Tax=unclassified Streptomyces TaxID=2593676 RepID=UPI0022B5FD8F|nr:MULTISPECIES: hypothetical protein [unclassified Streptomyces]MCZ7414905.1 hypothetical protein [Streptomyces sp. WMMC897]MCZ7431848.1 hypothetical protein [Streptomyces sp. WMMC1477]